MVNRLVSGLLIALCAGTLGFHLGRTASGRATPPVPATSTGPSIDKLEALGELVVQKVTVSDILTYREGSVTAAWLIRGDGLISVPLSGAHVEALDPVHRIATLVLPQPRVLSARVDHEKTRFWDARTGFWNSLNPWGTRLEALESPAMREAQRLVTHAVDSPEHREQARATTARLLQTVYSELGWRITIRWASDPGSPTSGDPSEVPPAGP